MLLFSFSCFFWQCMIFRRSQGVVPGHCGTVWYTSDGERGWVHWPNPMYLRNFKPRPPPNVAQNFLINHNKSFEPGRRLEVPNVTFNFNQTDNKKEFFTLNVSRFLFQYPEWRVISLLNFKNLIDKEDRTLVLLHRVVEKY